MGAGRCKVGLLVFVSAGWPSLSPLTTWPWASSHCRLKGKGRAANKSLRYSASACAALAESAQAAAGSLASACPVRAMANLASARVCCRSSASRAVRRSASWVARASASTRSCWEPVGLGASKARIGPSEDSSCRICSPIAQLWGKKTVRSEPLRSIRSRRSPSPTGSETGSETKPATEPSNSRMATLVSTSTDSRGAARARLGLPAMADAVSRLGLCRAVPPSPQRTLPSAAAGGSRPVQESVGLCNGPVPKPGSRLARRHAC